MKNLHLLRLSFGQMKTKQKQLQEEASFTSGAVKVS